MIPINEIGFFNMTTLTDSEKIGLDYICEQEECVWQDMRRGRNGRPDFIAPSGQRYEVKYIGKKSGVNNITFLLGQIKAFRNDDIIIVVQNGIIRDIFPWGNLYLSFKLKCLKCKNEWYSHKGNRICPKCKSVYWNREASPIIMDMEERIVKAAQLRAEGKTPQEVADELGVHLATVYRYYETLRTEEHV